MLAAGQGKRLREMIDADHAVVRSECVLYAWAHAAVQRCPPRSRRFPCRLFYNLRMSEPAPWTIYTDGASRANPGPAAFAYIIERPGESAIEEKGCLGDTTNNIAEYTALIRALEHAQRLGGRRLVINSDSELMVKQMLGAYKVK